MFRPWTVRCIAAVLTIRQWFSPRRVVVALAGALVGALSSCSDAPTAPIAVGSIVVSPGTATLASGASATLTAAVLDAKGRPLVGRVITWSSADTAIATVTGPGQVLAGPNRGGVASVVTISATSEGRSGSATLTVTPVAAARVVLSADSLRVQPGGTSAVTAVVQDASGAALAGRSVAWVSLDTTIARVSATGQVTSVSIPSYVGPDTRSTRIVATAEGVADTAQVVVTPLAVARVVLTASSVSLAAGTSRALTAEAQDAAGTLLTGRPIVWSVTDAGVATVSNVGLLTAAAYTGAETRLTSVIALVAGKADTAAVIVTPSPVATVTVAPATATVAVGGTQQLTATLRDAGSIVLTGRAVTWSSNAPGVATVSATGLVTAAAYTGAATRSATITATSEGRTSSATISVPPVPAARVVTSPSLLLLRPGDSTVVTAVVQDALGAELSERSVTWRSGDTTVARVTSTGQVTIPSYSGSATRNTKLIANVTDQFAVEDMVDVFVSPSSVARVVLIPDSVSLGAYATLTLTAEAQDAAGTPLTGRTIAWSVPDASIATVSSAGLLTAVAYVGPDTRLTRVIALIEGKADTAPVVVTPSPVAKVDVTPTNRDLLVGETLEMRATLQNASFVVLAAGRTVTWASSAPTVATVSATGLVTAVGPGTATISATSEGQTGTAPLNVSLAPVRTVTLDPATPTVYLGQTRQLTATLRDINTNILTGRAVTWTSSAPSVATVSVTGVVAAVALGTARISATSEGRTGFADVTVTGVEAVSAGGGHTMILMTDGTLWGAGYNPWGQIGDGTINLERSLPRLVMTGVRAVSAGGDHTMILKRDGTLWAAGKNDFGQLGDGTTENRSLPRQVMTGVQSVSAGFKHTLIVTTDGTLWATGDNSFGQLGDGTYASRATPWPIMPRVQAVSAGYLHTMILQTDGNLWATGENSRGQLGDPEGYYPKRSTPLQVMAGVQAVSAGHFHTMILRTDGLLLGVGNNDDGQIGDGTQVYIRNPPVLVNFGVQTVSAGSTHTMAVKTDGTLWAWGDNARGELGDGTWTDRLSPFQVMTGVQAVSGGQNYTMVVKRDGSLWATGSNAFGQLGDGTGSPRGSFIRIPLPN